MRLICPTSVIETTLSELQAAGKLRKECVMLWLGQRAGDEVRVLNSYRPLQTASADVFRIPPLGMSSLHAELRRTRTMVAAQVHSHPMEAFHSKADDEWAIVRHENALSLVVPYFATNTVLSNFLTQTKVFRYSSDSRWLEVPYSQVLASCLKIV